MGRETLLEEGFSPVPEPSRVKVVGPVPDNLHFVLRIPRCEGSDWHDARDLWVSARASCGHSGAWRTLLACCDSEAPGLASMRD